MDTSNDIDIRYGESLRLTTTIDSDLSGLESLTFYIGEIGSVLPVESIVATIEGSTAVIFKESITLPLGTYKYQYTAIYTDGHIEKFPSITSCESDGDDGLPNFTVHEALDIIEIS